jgi:hypothetical protein
MTACDYVGAADFYTKTSLAEGETWQFNLSKVWVWWVIYYQWNIINTAGNITLTFNVSGDNGTTFISPGGGGMLTANLANNYTGLYDPSVSTYSGHLSSGGVYPTTAFQVILAGSTGNTMNLQITGK